ncbi:MAG: single-stranded-DNA-specific exonuclease RecJ [Rhodospirillales bacterium 12-54-5]|nr:MAG: single-stranded-DNA-specific exonuclease RecJ [Rhodospirillales bacterium 12-54-5]
MQLPIHTASGIPWGWRSNDDRTIQAMAQQQGISELLARIMVGRGVTLDSATRFLNPSLREDLPNPSHLLDMDKAVARIIAAIHTNQPIAIFGDYDVDGATSTALLLDYFSALGVSARPYIPDRMKEGYGPTVGAFDTLIQHGIKLIITVDCGTMAHAPIAHANAQGVDVIVIDHHSSDGHLPPAFAVVNPNRADETSPCGALAAVGVTFLLLIALTKNLREAGFFSTMPREPKLLAMLDLVALGTVCDVMPLTGLNRTFVAQGLKVLAQRQRIGLASLSDVARMNELPTTYHLGFLLGPRINAGGRVGESGLGTELLTTQDPDHATAIAARLDHYNTERQAIEASVLEQALALAEAQANMPVMLIAAEGWHQGVIGIVAGRLKEKYARPVAVISLENGVGKASARSVTGADMGAAIHAAHAQGMLLHGGGHAMAAGFSVLAEQIPALHAFLVARMEAAVNAYSEARITRLDGWISCQSATMELLDDIGRAAPYGMGNPSPKFALNAAKIVRVDVLKEKHLRCILTDDVGGERLTAMAFGAVGTPLGEWLQSGMKLHLAGELKRNVWQGEASAQFIIADAAKIV